MTRKKLLSLLLALALLASLAVPAFAAETATVVRLTKTTGTVEISKSSGKSVSLLQNMRLYNGYHVSTDEESYAWINLDDSKLLKEDAESEVEFRKDGKKLEVQITSGNVFFDVAKPLEDDESMNIRSSTLAVGIRGTSGWVEVEDRWTTRVSVLEGVVECSVADPVTGQLKAEEVRGGETAVCVVYPREQPGDKCDILMEKYTTAEIPGYVLTDVVRDMALCDKIEEATGLDIPRDLAAIAGGDPSGREPGGERATPEVLGEAERREDADEADLREKLEELERAQGPAEKQPDGVSPDKALPKNPGPAAPSDGDSGRDAGGDSGGSTATPEPAPPPSQSHGMKLTAAQVQALLDAGSSVSVEPNTDASDTTPKKNTLEADTDLTVAAGKTLDLQSGIDVEVPVGRRLQVDGTLTADALQNSGTTTVTSGNTLRLRGNLTNAGTLNVTATGRIVVDGTFTSSGTAALTSGAKVLAKAFAPGAAPEGWEVSAEADADGYYSLVASTPVTPPNPPAPKTYKITFSANGDSGTPAPMTTGPDGKLTDIPYFTSVDYESRRFSGWYTAENLTVMGSQPIDRDTVFTSDTTVYARWFGWKYDAGTLTVIGSVMDEQPYFGDHKDEVTNVVILDGMTNIGSDAFNGYSNMTSVEIPSSVTSIGDKAFWNCPGLTNIEIPSNVTSIGSGAFGYCRSLTNIEIPPSVISIGENAFSECASLTGIAVNAGNPSYSSDDIALFNKGQTMLIQFPEGYSGAYVIPNSVTSIGESAFGQCRELTDVTIPSSVTSIGMSAFSDCYYLSSVTIPSDSELTSIGDNAFSNCDLLRSVDIPDSVTSIGADAFLFCSSLTGVTIPKGVKSIGRQAFAYCNMSALTFKGTVVEWEALRPNIGTGAIPTSVTVIHCDGGDTAP